MRMSTGTHFENQQLGSFDLVTKYVLALRIFIGVERNLFGSFTLKLGAMGNPLGNIEPYMNEGDFSLSI